MRRRLQLFAFFALWAVVSVPEAFATKYYIGPGGSDSNTPADAQNAATPWATFAGALSQMTAGDTLEVLQGSYAQSFVMNKSITLMGSSGGSKPVLRRGGTTSYIIDVRAQNATIANLRFEYDATGAASAQAAAIYSNYIAAQPATRINGLKVMGNEFISVSPSPSPADPYARVFASYAMLFTNNGTGSSDMVTISGNTVGRGAGAALFGRAVRMLGGRAMIGGSNPADGNDIDAYYGLQLGDVTGGATTIENNTIKGRAIEITALSANTGQTVVRNNTLIGQNTFDEPALIEVRDIRFTTASLLISGNTLSGFTRFGVLLGRVRNASVVNNTFSPNVDSNFVAAIHFNTKRQTTGNDNLAFDQDVVIAGNTFNGTTGTGAGIQLGDHNHMASQVVTVKIGGSTADSANTFARTLRTYIELDSSRGNSQAFGLWAPYPATTMRPWRHAVNAQGNRFDMAGTPTLATALDLAAMTMVEDKIRHRADYDSLGFVTLRPNFGILTPNSTLGVRNPLANLNNVINGVPAGSTIWVAPGNYQFSANVNKPLTILGGDGSGTKPMVVGNGGVNQAVFHVTQPDVTIQNFEMMVNQTNTLYGVRAVASGSVRPNNLRVIGNTIWSTRAKADATDPHERVFASWGVFFDGGSGGSMFTFQGNAIKRQNANSTYFGRGFRVLNGHGLIGGPSAADSNYTESYYGIQYGALIGGALTIQGNAIGGFGLEFTDDNVTSQASLITGNRFFGIDTSEHLGLISIRNWSNSGRSLTISNNQFENYTLAAVYLGRTRGVQVVNNNFTPAAGSGTFYSLVANTKRDTRGSDNVPLVNNVTIQGNTFNGSGSGMGTSVLFANHDNRSTFGDINLGGAGSLANTFNAGVKYHIALDTSTGSSSRNAYYLANASTVTPQGPFGFDFSAGQNIFGLTGGNKRGVDMTTAELFELEDLLMHKPEFDSLGLISILPNQAFVTANSFLPGRTTVPSLQRLGTRNMPGLMVTTAVNTFNEVLMPDSNLSVASANGMLTLGGINLNKGANLSLMDSTMLTGNLVLGSGNVVLGNNVVLSVPAAGIGAGNANSYVVTNGTARLQARNVTDAAVVFPVGSATAFAPITFDDANNTGDDISAGVAAAANGAAFTPALPGYIVKFVNLQYFVSEATAGGSDAQLTFGFNSGNEVNGPLNVAPAIGRNFGGAWTFNLASGYNAGASMTIGNQTSFGSYAAVDLIQAPGMRYYVNETTGDDSRAPIVAMDPTTPWKTIGHAIRSVLSTDTIDVAPVAGFTYVNRDTIKVPMVILGNGGMGTKPMVEGLTTPSQAVFTVQAPNVTIQNFEIRVNQTTNRYGIRAQRRTASNGASAPDSLKVLYNHIVSTSTKVDATDPYEREFNSWGIYIDGSGSGAGTVVGTQFTIQGNRIYRLNNNTRYFGRAIRVLQAHGLIGGPNAADSNYTESYYGIQYGSLRNGALVVENNVLGGFGIEFTDDQATAQASRITGNRFYMLDSAEVLAHISIREWANSGSQLTISNNSFSGYVNSGVYVGRSRNVVVSNNTFTPAAGAASFASLVANTKRVTRGTDANAIVNTITAQGNTFNGAGSGRGASVLFANHDAASSFGTITLGGAGALANTFNGGVQYHIALDTATGNSNRNAYYLGNLATVTQMRPFGFNLFAGENNFALAKGVKRGSELALEEQFELEDLLLHKPEFDSLGLISILPNQAFVTANSFVTGRTTAPSVQRLGTRNMPGLMVTTAVNTFSEVLMPDSNLSVNSAAGMLTFDGINLNKGANLTLMDSTMLTGNLVLGNGHVILGNTNVVLTVNGPGNLTAGNASSYVQTSATSRLRVMNVTDAPVTFPVGSASSFAPITLDDANNTGDSFSAGVADAGAANAFNPALPGFINRFVNLQFFLEEGTPGGSNATVTFNYNAANENNPFTAPTVAFSNGSRYTYLDADAYTSGSSVSLNNVSNFGTFALIDLTQAPGTRYYVNETTGDDSRAPIVATDPATPWKTFRNAVRKTLSGDTIDVAPVAGFAYAVNDTLDHSLVILGNGGMGTKPVLAGQFNAAEAQATRAAIKIDAPGVEIINFDIEVNNTSIPHAIYARTPGFDGLRITDNRILATGAGTFIFNSYGIRLYEGATGSAIDSFTIARNYVGPKTLGVNATFGRAVRLFGGHGVIGGMTPADSNYFIAVYGVQAGNPRGGSLRVMNNSFNVGSVEINNPSAGSGSHYISNNRFASIVPGNTLTYVEVKENINNTPILIENNRFDSVGIFGVMSTRSRNVFVNNNVFTPARNANVFAHIYVNTKQQTTSTSQAPTPNSISIQGNQFNGNANNGGLAISLNNLNGASADAFSDVTIGGAGSLANTFDSTLASAIRLDWRTGVSTTDPLFASYPATDIFPVGDSIDLSENNFLVAGGLKRPAAMTVAELYEVEDMIDHNTDVTNVGFVTVVPNQAFITPNSFITAAGSTAPSLARVVDGATDGLLVYTSVAGFNETVSIESNVRLDAEPNTEISIATLSMNGVGKQLTFNDPLRVTTALNLNNGNIVLDANSLTLSAGATVAGGSASSYVVTAAGGRLVREGVTDDATLFPVGTNTAYTPVTYDDANNTGDAIGVRVAQRTTAASFSPTLPPSLAQNFVPVQYYIDEATAGGSNATLTLCYGNTTVVGNVGSNPAIARSNAFTWFPTNGTIAGNCVTAGTFPGAGSYVIASFNQIAGTKYYVDQITGLDSRSNIEAQNRLTPWATIKKAVKSVVDGDTIIVMGNAANTAYVTSDTITNSIMLAGDDELPGSIKPVVEGTVGSPAIFTVGGVPNVTIRNFRLLVSQSTVANGILARTNGFNNLTIRGNEIFSTCPVIGVGGCGAMVFNSYGVHLVSSANDGVTIQGNSIRPLNPGSSSIFGRAVRLTGVWGIVGGPAAADTNLLAAYYGLQGGGIEGSNLLVTNNSLYANGVELTEPRASAANSRIFKNRFIAGPQPGAVVALLAIRGNDDGASILVDSNTFSGYTNIGAMQQRSRDISFHNNVFTPEPGSYASILATTKQETTGNVAAIANTFDAKGNTFNVAGTNGTAIMLANHDSRFAGEPFSSIVIGGSAAGEANTFYDGHRHYIYLDTANGPSTRNPLYFSSPATPMVPFGQYVIAQFNNYEVSGGVKLPSAMSQTELYELEDRIAHAVDYPGLGFVEVVPGTAYVTDSSYLAPAFSTASLQRAANISRAANILTEVETFNEVVNFPFATTVDLTSADTLRLDGIQLNTASGDVTIVDNVNISDTLNFLAGRLQMADKTVTLLANANAALGNPGSYAAFSPAGKMVHIANGGASAANFPVGTNANYGAVSIANASPDVLTVMVKDAPPFTAALPTAAAGFVKLEWMLNERTVGDNNADVSFFWGPAAEQGNLTANVRVAQYNGTLWERRSTTASAQMATGTGVKSLNTPFAVFADPRPIAVVATTNSNSYCATDSILVTVSTDARLNPGNAFTVQLSDAAGLFTSPTVLGVINADTTTNQRFALPTGIASGSAYAVRILSSDPSDTSDASLAFTVLPKAATPTIQVLTSTTICDGDSVLLTGPAGATAYAWSTGATSQTIYAKTAGDYRLSVTYANTCPSDTSAAVTITVSPVPAAATLAIDNDTVCSGGTATLTAATGFAEYVFITPTGNVTQAGNTLQVSDAGTYGVQVRSAAGACLSDTSVLVSLTVNPAPAVPTVTASGNLAICQGSSVKLAAASAGATSYIWYESTNVIAGQNTDTLVVTAAGSYTVAAVVGTCTSAVSAASVVTVNPAPAAPTLTAASTTICGGGTVAINAAGAAGATFEWFDANGQIAGQFTGQINVSAAGSYQAVQIVNGCRSALSTAVVITAATTPGAATVTASGSTNFCQGGSVTLTATATDANTYRWFNGPTEIAGQTGATLVVTASGDYTVRGVNGGCEGAVSTATTVTVTPTPTTPTLAIAQTGICQGSNTTITATGPAGATYEWSLGTTVIPGTGATITVDQAGNYTAVAIVNGCRSAASTAVSLTVNPRPATPVLSLRSAAICSGDSTSIVVTGAPAGATFSFYLAGVLVRTTTIDSIRVGAAGNYKVTVSVGGCASDSSNSVSPTVNPTPTTPSITATGATTFCAGGSVTLNGPAGQPGYLWSNGATTQSITVNASGSYTLRIVNASGCSSAVSTPVAVNVTPLPVATISANGPTSFCVGGNVTLTASGGSSFIWSNGATTPSITVSADGNYTVQVIDNGCTSAVSAVTTITTGNAPSILISRTTALADSVDEITIGKGETVSVNAVERVAQTGVTYTWTRVGSSAVVSTTPNLTVTPDESGSYVVTAVSASASGCSTSDTVRILVGQEVFIPNYFSPNSRNVENTRLRVYGYGIASISLKIYNRMGNLVFESSNVDEITDLGWDGRSSGKELESDTYFWVVDGKMTNGQDLKIDGKTAGTVFLAR